ncbi:MAG: hypothetical protein LAT78_08795, partial [Roseinatronobacter sp.]|nr:hypothetical protein [Roseinatronobacter sp.]
SMAPPGLTPQVQLQLSVCTPLRGLGILAVLLSALVLATLNAGALMQSADQALLSQSGLLSLILVYPVMKALHELAHCYALYRFGGRVRLA